MKPESKFYLVLIFILVIAGCNTSNHQSYFENIPKSLKRNFLGNEFWGNRLQDWEISNGRLNCVDGTNGIRTMFPLQYELNNELKEFKAEVTTGILHDHKINPQALTGFIIGAGNLDMDYRGRSLVFGRHGQHGGYLAGISGDGKLVVMDMDNRLEIIAESPPLKPDFIFSKHQEFVLQVNGFPEGGDYKLILTIKNNPEKLELLVPVARIEGNIGLVAHFGHGEGLGSFWYKKLLIEGEKLSFFDKRILGPIVSTQHTLSKNILKLTAQMVPISENDEQAVILEFRNPGSNAWGNASETTINKSGYTASFKVENWDDKIDREYRVSYNYIDNRGATTKDTYNGIIKKNPKGKDEIVIAAFTGNNNTTWHSNAFDRTNLFFPHEDLTSRVASHQPDFLFYSGDQLYEGSPSAPDRSGGRSSALDYLYKWYLWCWAHRELTRNTPSVTIPDDHDVYHGNLWGDGGSIPPKKPKNGQYPEHYKGGFEGHWVQDFGGYRMGTDFVNMVERTQTSHLPDPYDPSKVKNDIGVYYTDINYGGISFAVLEDRKFKSPPARILPEDKIVNGFSQIEGYDGTIADRDSAILLGERQLQFIENWAADWADTWMKVSLTQTIFANVSTYPDTFKTDAGTPRLQPLPQGIIPKDYSLAKDMDSNGWPQSGRNRALRALRKGFTFMLAGDQHLGSIVHHGIDDWKDAGISFCVPSVANVWPRRWFPPGPGQNHTEGMPDYTGDYLDGFGNHMTIHAVSNPYISNVYPSQLHDRAPGYGIVKLNKKDQKIILECWPRHADPSVDGKGQYPGWPFEFDLSNNYGKTGTHFLPEINCQGLDFPPVVQVINEVSSEIIYTVRVKNSRIKVKVFEPGTYTIKVGEPNTVQLKTITGLIATKTSTQKEISIQF